MRLPLFLAAGLALISVGFASDPAFERFADDITSDWMRTDPQGATTQQYFSGDEQDALDRRLTKVDPAARAARVEIARRALAQLETFDRAKLDQSQRISAAMLQWHFEEVVAQQRFEQTRFVFQQFSGLQVRLVNFLSQIHPIRNRRDVENYQARLEQVAPTMADGMIEARRRADKGYLPPRFILTATLAQFERFLEGAASQNVLVASLDERLAKLANIPADERSRLTAAAEKTVREQVIPAFRAAQAMLQEQLPKATDDAGVWRFPEGADAYGQALKELTTTTYTAAQIHELGLKEVARIEQDMDGLFRQLGYNEGSINERMDRLTADVQPQSDPDPRPALIARYESILEDALRRAAKVFEVRPVAPVIVKREPPFTEKSASAHYSRPSKDGTRPGIFWAPLPGPTFNTPGMRTLVYHEAIPGHHFQIALQQENTALPKFRQFAAFGSIPAYSEGWALYAEQIAVELGWYEGDPRSRLGQLNAELFRARRLVVDSGLHAMRWTRQQAINYGIRASEVERYVVWPGQACSYKVGQLKILELRAKAKLALGERFSLGRFHEVVLRNGGVPLEVLEGAVDDYIKGQTH